MSILKKEEARPGKVVNEKVRMSHKSLKKGAKREKKRGGEGGGERDHLFEGGKKRWETHGPRSSRAETRRLVETWATRRKRADRGLAGKS